IRMVFQHPNVGKLVVRGPKLDIISQDPVGGWSAEEMGTLESSVGRVMAATIVSGTGIYTVIVDGIKTYLYSAGTLSTFDSLSYGEVEDATNVIFLDGYLIYCTANSNQFFVSDWQQFTVDPLSFASAE